MARHGNSQSQQHHTHQHLPTYALRSKHRVLNIFHWFQQQQQQLHLLNFRKQKSPIHSQGIYHYQLPRFSFTAGFPHLFQYLSENMQTLQSDSRGSESHMGLPDQPTASTSYNVGCNSPYLPKQSEGNQFHSQYYAPYPTTEKRLFRLKRVYSNRTRGRSGPLQSLARKLGRFKVRTVVVGVGDTANQECKQNR